MQPTGQTSPPFLTLYINPISIYHNLISLISLSPLSKTLFQMGDRATLAKAKKELEDLYLGVPDESVNLTFQDFAQVRQHNAEKPKPSLSPTMETISEKSQQKSPRSSPLAKLPSLDFSKGLEATFPSPHHHHPQDGGGGMWGHGDHDHGHHRHHLDHGGDQRSMMYDDMSVAYGPERGVGRRRPGIPHSNICAICCNYIYICRHRCLVYLIFHVIS